jgi:hypothetical protein
LESNNEKILQRILELQKKALEGRKNALNLEMNHNKENMRQLIGMLRQEERNSGVNDKIEQLLTLLEQNNELIKALAEKEQGFIDNFQEENKPSAIEADFTEGVNPAIESDFTDGINPAIEADLTEEFYPTEEAGETREMDLTEETDPAMTDLSEKMDLSEATDPAMTDPSVETTEDTKITPLYDDPNKALTADEIAALFASFGK